MPSFSRTSGPMPLNVNTLILYFLNPLKILPNPPRIQTHTQITFNTYSQHKLEVEEEGEAI